MSVQWEAIQKRADSLSQLLAGSSIEPRERHTSQKEFSLLSTLLEKKHAIDELQRKIEEATVQAADNSDAEMADLFQEELRDLRVQKQVSERAIDDMLYPANPYDKKSIFLEIRAGAGGQEAALFAGDLLTLYSNYAERKGWTAAVTSISDTDLGGIREVAIHIQGEGAYGHLKYESGVHRVQRVPKTESAGRIHTSTATVAVFPELDEIEVDINPADLRIDVYRSGGAGGQHVNTTDSAVRITHIPTGVVVACQDERSQHKNKAKALKILQARILTAHQEKQHAEMSEARKELVGRGMRAEKVRTYNYPQNRITDHQVELTLKKLDVIMAGDLDEIVHALQENDHQERRKRPLNIV